MCTNIIDYIVLTMLQVPTKLKKKIYKDWQVLLNDAFY